MQLKPYQEIVGNLSDVITNNDFTKAIFSIMLEVDIPIDDIDELKLRKYVGQRVGLLNNNGEIRIRKIKRKGGE
jgi:hypothetical protein